MKERGTKETSIQRIWSPALSPCLVVSDATAIKKTECALDSALAESKWTRKNSKKNHITSKANREKGYFLFNYAITSIFSEAISS